jgi:APA family basic amino acid/polyamine antiporter
MRPPTSAGELQHPQRSLPDGTDRQHVAGVYRLPAAERGFLAVAPMDAMVGKVEVGYVAASFVFGEAGASIMGVLLALLLVSTVSAMILAGPRVLHRIGQDFALFRPLGRLNRDGIPAVAVIDPGRPGSGIPVVVVL